MNTLCSRVVRKALPWLWLALSACGATSSTTDDGGTTTAAIDSGPSIAIDAGSTSHNDAGSTSRNDGGTSVDADAGATGPFACVARPVPPDATNADHTTHPTVYGVTGPLTVVSDSTLANPEWPGHPLTVYRPEGAATYPVLF